MSWLRSASQRPLHPFQLRKLWCGGSSRTMVDVRYGRRSRIYGDPAKQQMIPYAAFSEIPQPSVPGHAGRFVLGEVEKTKIIFAQGRVHLYEGYSAREVTSIVRVVAEAGIKQLIVTNAAGALNPKFKPGECIMITDV